jgi:hypothetical protein
MPNDDTPPPPPDLIVLEALKETCEAVRRHNANPEVAKAALQWETRFAASMKKIQAGGAAGDGREAA